MNRSGPEKAYGLLRVEAELAHSLSGLTGGSEVTLAPYCNAFTTHRLSGTRLLLSL